MNNYISRSFASLLLLLMCSLINAAHAQTQSSSTQQQPDKPTVIMPEEKAPPRVAGKTELYCGGFIQYAPAPNDMQIVGGEQEQEQRVYSEGDYVYINRGAQQGIKVGQEFSVIRPRGQFKTKLSKKKGWLGVYTQELGQLRVVEVKERVSVALITASCETVLLGDLLRPAQERVSPFARQEVLLDRFSNSSGKSSGRIILARDLRESVTRSDIVYIDLGMEDNLKPGDYLTIYRQVGKGNITGNLGDREITINATSGFQSDKFRGGKFSNEAPRVEDPNNTGVYGPVETTDEVKDRRPRLPRKVVGEMVVLSVQKRTATAIITRVAQEVHTGDFVEVQ